MTHPYLKVNGGLFQWPITNALLNSISYGNVITYLYIKLMLAQLIPVWKAVPRLQPIPSEMWVHFSTWVNLGSQQKALDEDFGHEEDWTS